mgnify:CR=1 FL=1
MVSVYKITDCNGLNYIGTTKQKLSCRMSEHRYAKRNPNREICSSSKLDLDNCHITLLETCNNENRKIREQYWIDKIECVNKINSVKQITNEEYIKHYNITNREKVRERNRIWWAKNKDIRNSKRRKQKS